MITLIVSALIVSMLLVIWFDTEALVEYLGWLNIFPPITQFKQFSADASELTFIQFLSEYYGGFVIRLITCPICFSVWLSLLVSFIFHCTICFLATSFLSLCFYRVFHKLK